MVVVVVVVVSSDEVLGDPTSLAQPEFDKECLSLNRASHSLQLNNVAVVLPRLDFLGSLAKNLACMGVEHCSGKRNNLDNKRRKRKRKRKLS